MSQFISTAELAALVGYEGSRASFSEFVRRKATMIENRDPVWAQVWQTRILVGRGYKYPRARVLRILGA